MGSGEVGELGGEEMMRLSKTEIEEKLYDSTLEGNWELVVRIYKERGDAGVYSTSITRSKDTALHVAVKDGQADSVVELADAIMKHGEIKSLKIENEGGDTPLHCAASGGSLKMCQCIIEKCIIETTDLIKARNHKGETPLYLAARHGHKKTFLYLHSLCQDKSVEPCRRSDGDTILHSTISRDYFDLVGSVDEKGISPLHILADKPSAFESSSNFRWWNKLAYNCIAVESLMVEVEQQHGRKENVEAQRKAAADTENPCCDGNGNGHVAKKRRRSCYEVLVSAYDPLVLLALALFGAKDLRKKKQKHVWSGQVLEALWERSSKVYVRGGSEPELSPMEEFDSNIFSFYKKTKQQIDGRY
ncbi:putative non-specific serine/threonine protein kinase [Senna tora]|uniref:Putative non-specific serine/threonine protein kinase n=1 Tax=Senna tora TaxID=362788 RepID=A0A834WCJ3_9FABA|nr:putative non-specific serine/threonine protein kinase [Senna tora]